MKINNYNINCYNSITDLCEIGNKYGTDKSPMTGNLSDKSEYYGVDYRHSYTSFYSILFSKIKNEKINFCEIGIAFNASTKMWREYFPNAKLYAFDGSLENLENAKKDNLENTTYGYMHTGEERSIIQAFLNCDVKFDVLIDDASHFFWDQIRLIRLSANYLNKNSLLIIEDVDDIIPEYEYINQIKLYGHDQYFSSISFIKFHHENSNLGIYNNDKIILITVK